jgi:hypothetical protein
MCGDLRSPGSAFQSLLSREQTLKLEGPAAIYDPKETFNTHEIRYIFILYEDCCLPESAI